MMQVVDKELVARLKNFEVGARFKQLATIKGKESPSYWVKVLGLNHRNQVYHRWNSNDLESKEILLICQDLNITLSDFFAFEEMNQIINEPSMNYGKKVYLEDQIAEALIRITNLENALKI